MENVEIRGMMKKAGLAQWRVADEIGIGEYTFTRWLRRKLSDERRERVLAAIERLTASQERGRGA